MLSLGSYALNVEIVCTTHEILTKSSINVSCQFKIRLSPSLYRSPRGLLLLSNSNKLPVDLDRYSKVKSQAIWPRQIFNAKSLKYAKKMLPPWLAVAPDRLYNFFSQIFTLNFFFLSKWSIQWEIYNKYLRPKLFGPKLFWPKAYSSDVYLGPAAWRATNVNISIPTGEWIAEMSLAVTWGKCEAAC